MLVNRLSSDPSVRVVLVEPGEPGEHDPAVTTPGRWASLLGTSYDWNYTTEPEPGLEQRRLACPRGRALGGSSAINAMVHIRGGRAAFDRWEALGNSGWGFDSLLPFFTRSERNDLGAAPHRGVHGPLAVSRCHDPHAAHAAFLRAAETLGFRADEAHDFNRPEPEGVAGFVQKNILDGRRHSAAAAFLLPALARPNVEVRRARVTRLVVEGHRAAGVECLQNGALDMIRAQREIILCAGAIDSPRLLLLSGIGDPGDLRALGIPIAAAVPGVGRNLQDHLKLPVRWQGKTTLPGSTVTAGLFTSSAPGRGIDLQFYVGRGLEHSDAFITITVSPVRVASRGCLRLRSADPAAPPAIHMNYLQASADVDAIVRGLRLARALGASEAYERLRGDEIAPGPAVTSDADLAGYARASVESIYHLAGTCRMGPESDTEAVVDPQLRVRGVDGLRIADASIMPEVVNAPTHAACVMIGEKCAALIAGGGNLS